MLQNVGFLDTEDVFVKRAGIGIKFVTLFMLGNEAGVKKTCQARKFRVAKLHLLRHSIRCRFDPSIKLFNIWVMFTTPQNGIASSNCQKVGLLKKGGSSPEDFDAWMNGAVPISTRCFGDPKTSKKS
jgi:hypothetical protein